jgi:hypothetical protein
MSDEASKDGKPAFTVSDRRKRYDADAPAAAEPASPPPPAEPEAAAPAPETAPETGPGPETARGEGAPAGDGQAAGPGGETGPIGPADFVQLVGKLYEEALVFMGYHDDPRAGQSMRNLPVATWHIDVLELLKEKTKGNLSAEEAKLLEDAVANLKLLFVRASGYIKH